MNDDAVGFEPDHVATHRPQNCKSPTIRRGLWFLRAALIVPSILALPAQAQIIPDATLPTPSIVTELDPQTYQIEGGTIAGSNLFHSFGTFNQSGALSGSTIRFEPEATIANIFARVTGRNGTTIDGRLQTTGSANLYLIDPQGIQFGANAALDLGGALIATSADRVQFADGTEWLGRGETTPNASMLTISTPVGLQFDARAMTGSAAALSEPIGTLRVSGTGHSQRFFTPDSAELIAILDAITANDPTINRDLLLRLGATIDIVGETDGITAQTPQPIALVGRNIVLKGGQIETPGSAVELVAIESGTLTLAATPANPLGILSGTLGDPIVGDLTFGNITLSDAAAINTSGVNDYLGGGLNHEIHREAGSGTVYLRGNDLVFDDGSVIFARPLGGGIGGQISLEASGEIRFQGISPIDAQGSGIIGGTLGAGRGSDIVLNADNIMIRDGGFLSSTTFASGSGGNTTITARNQFEIVGTNGAESLSVIFSDSAGVGTAGQIAINADRVRVADGAQLTARSQQSGTGGTIHIHATDQIELSGVANRGGVPFIANTSRDTFPSGLFAIVEAGATGNAGNMDISARSLDIRGGAQLIANTSGSGNAGNVTIRARDNVSIVGASASGLTRSNIASSIRPGATGNGGVLDVETSRFELLDTAFISVTSFGDGHGGSLNVRADTVTVRGASATNELIFGGIFAEVRSPDRISGLGLTGEATGQGGSVTLDATDRVAILDGAAISVLTDTTGNAGDLTLRAATVEIGGVVEIPTASPANPPFNRASISAGAEELGRGGTLRVEADRLIVRDGGRITVGTEGRGNAGDLTIIARESALIEGVRTITTNGVTLLPSTISASSENTAISPASGNAGALNLIVGDLTLRNGGQISVNSDNQGSTGDLQIQAETIAVLEGGRITAESVVGNRGNIQIASDAVQLRRNGRIDANAQGDATGGNVSIDSETIAALDHSAISANAITGSGGQIRIQTSGLFLAPDSTIEASSRFGVNGLVAIDAPEANNTTGIIDLTANPFDGDQLIATACSATSQDGRLTMVGRTGLPDHPISAHRDSFALVYPQALTTTDLEPSEYSSEYSSARSLEVGEIEMDEIETGEIIDRPMDLQPETHLEAQTWAYDRTGQLQLLAHSPRSPFTPHYGCASSSANAADRSRSNSR